MNNKLFSKIYGCEAAATIANSMGDVTEGFTYMEIEERWGFVDQLLEQNKFGRDNTIADRRRPQPYGPDFVYHGHFRPPGMTEDGHERHRLCSSAIIRKGGRIDIYDLADTWVKDIDPSKFGYILGPQDQVILNSIKAGIPPWEIGKFATYPSKIGTAKMILPVGMVNACNPDRAAQDAFDLGRIKDVRGVPDNFSLEACAAVAAACAEAMKPASTIDSVIDAALFYLSKFPKKEVELGLSWAKNADSWKDIRPLYEEKYHPYNASNAVEVLSGALACFYIANGNPRDAILYSVNLGRDCDCRAYIAGGLTAAMKGIEEVPADWVKVVEEQVVTDPYTVSTRTARETALGIYNAAIKTMDEMSASLSLLKELVKPK